MIPKKMANQYRQLRRSRTNDNIAKIFQKQEDKEITKTINHVIMKMTASCLAFSLCLGTGMSARAGILQDMTARNTADVEVEVNQENLSDMAEERSDMPKEVLEYIEQTLEENENAEVTVSTTGGAAAPGISTFSSSGSWSSVRKYKGYSLKDWTVTVRNAFNMTDFKTGSTAGKFAKQLTLHIAGKVANKFIPFASDGMTLIQFISDNPSAVRAGSGDKASAAPKYTSYAKFTYVKSGNDYVLGARTHKAKLESIHWYYYNDKKHKTYSKTKSSNKTSQTSAFSSPDSKAVLYYGSGGYLQNPIDVTINGKEFVLD